MSINDPYKGVELIRVNGNPAHNRHSIQVEVNRRLYMDEINREPNPDFDTLQQTFTSLSQHIAGYIHTKLQG